MDLSIFFAGTGGSIPTARRGLPSILIRRGGDRILVDCGEGTQRQLVSSVGLADLTEIFLTHFHADHWLGLPGMLKTFDLRGREAPLTISGPPGLRALMGLALRMAGSVGFDLEMVDSSPATCSTATATASPPSRSHIAGRARLRALRGRAPRGVPQGDGAAPRPDGGPGVRPRAARRDDPRDHPRAGPRSARPGRKLVLSGDTRPCEALRIAAHRADVLVHEATFAEEERERAADNGHSTAQQAATIAKEAEVALLALNHVSTRHPLGQLRDEARAIFPNTVVPRDFDTIEIPFAERGEPSLLRWNDRMAEPPPAPAPTS